MKLNEQEIKKGGSILLIPVDYILPNPDQPRRVFSEKELNELAQSVKNNGIIQPLIVRKTDDFYELISGERRLRAAKMVGLSTVPCVLMSVSREKSALFSIIENIQRSNLFFFEEAESIETLLEYFNDSSELAEKLGKNQEIINNGIKFCNINQEIRNEIVINKLSDKQIEYLLEIQNRDDFQSVLKYIISNSLSDDETLMYINNINKTSNHKLVTFKKLKDIRIFINTINHAVDTMCKAGIKTEFSENESEEFFEYYVKIPKTASSPAVNGL